MTDRDRITTDVAVVGGGLAGLTAAIALAGGGVATTLISRRSQRDLRTTALLAGSVTALQTLGVWEVCRGQAAPLRVVRIVDDTVRLLRGPEVAFAAADIGLDAFGYTIENRHLLAALDARAAELPALTRIEDEVELVAIEADRVAISLKARGKLSARLAIGADGRRSLCRTAAGIALDEHSYTQTALTCNLRHARPHDDTSTEFHTERGPFTLVPLPGKRSNLICVLDPADAERFRGFDDIKLADEFERRAHSILGRFEVEPERGFFPLSVATARQFAAGRVALVGEAAHLVPPIGAQGLNLSLRDAATIAELAVETQRAGADIGGAEMLARYDVQRRADIRSRVFATDMLNRTLLSDFLPLHGARGLGLYLIDRIGPLRRAIMREGVTPSLAQPRLMRGEAL